jgi:hypothetical protein
MSNWKTREYAPEILFTFTFAMVLVYLANVIPA